MLRSFAQGSLFGALVLFIVTVVMSHGQAGAADRSGEELFKQHCAVCHPEGGNIVNPQKTLHKKDLTANHVKSAKDIIAKMRNPGPGMLKFDAKTISDGDAEKIASFVMSHYGRK